MIILPNLAALQFTSSLIAAPEKPHARMCHTPKVGPLQPIGNIQANGPLLSHPSQHTDPMSPQGSIHPRTSSTNLLRSSSPLSFHSHSGSSEYPSGSSSIEGTGVPASPTSAGRQPSVSVPHVIRRAGETKSECRSKIKITDFNPEFHSTIHLTCRYYQVILCTHEPFPLENEQDRYLREAWQLACVEHEVNLKANRDVLNLVKQDDHVYQDQLATLVRELKLNHGILFKDHEACTGLFENPCTARILLTNAPQIENCVDEWKDGGFCSIDFTEKLYREKYQSYLTNLEKWGDHGQGRHILAQLQKHLHDKARTLCRAGDLQTTLPAIRKHLHDIFNAAVREATSRGEEEMLE
ncbi:hypothetical protein JB92DRAFT_3107239 [Gautieria morchelliformis]|nr:hypothetical protein JB92DRAFT_3107239 [Gautieria morchelliformis]